MTRKEGVSRRALLGSLGAVGTAGATLGVGTRALFTDTETLPGSVASAGRLDLLVSWPDGTSEDGTATLAIDLTDGGSGSETISVELPDSNPGRVWLRTRCPSGPADSISGTLSYACDDSVVASGSLLAIANELRNGVHLDPACATDDGCLDGDERLELRFEWEFTPTDDYNGTDPDDVELQVEFHASQCRHDPTPSNPFPEIEPCVEYYGISYVEIYADEDGDGCGDDESPLGKIELDSKGNYEQDGIGDSDIEEGTYDLYVDEDGEDTGYDIEVTDTVEKDDGEETVAIAFELVDPDGADPELCEVVIKGANETTAYTDFDDNATGGLLYAPVKGGP